METQQAGLAYISSLVLGGVALTACVLLFAGVSVFTGTVSPPASEGQEWTVPGQGDVPNASGRRACRQFRDAQRDAAAGTITPAEMRVQLWRVTESARVSGNTTIRREAEMMLHAIKQGDSDTLDSAAERMSRECAKDGL
jgi:hypothetical protein